MTDYLKYIPAIVLLVTFIASFSVSQYQIGLLVDNVKDLQQTQSDLVINQAIIKERIKWTY